VLFYALNVMLTRKLRTTDSSATMAYYSSLIYLVAAVISIPLPIVVGEMPGAHSSIAFLFRPWAMPTLVDGARAGLGRGDVPHGARLQPGVGLGGRTI
jgi:hypothetical protein